MNTRGFAHIPIIPMDEKEQHAFKQDLSSYNLQLTNVDKPVILHFTVLQQISNHTNNMPVYSPSAPQSETVTTEVVVDENLESLYQTKLQAIFDRQNSNQAEESSSGATKGVDHNIVSTFHHSDMSRHERCTISISPPQ